MDIKIEAFVPRFTPPQRRDKQAADAEQPRGANKDSFTPSEQTKKALGNTEAEKTMLEEMLESGKSESEAQAKGFEVLAKCMKIASRIMNGHVVPMKDHKFLAENYPDIYERAVLMRRVNPEPKKYKSLVEDEEETTEETGDTGGDDGLSEDRAAVEGASEGGGAELSADTR